MSEENIENTENANEYAIGYFLKPHADMPALVKLPLDEEGDVDYDAMKEVLGIEYINVKQRLLNGKTYSFVFDDDVLLKENPVPTVIAVSEIDSNLYTQVFGPVLVFNSDWDYLRSLNDEDIESLKKSTSYYKDPNDEKQVVLIVDSIKPKTR